MSEQGAPAHVKPEQVLDFDIFAEPSLLENPHRGYRALQQSAPEIFYTPRNGGHWVVTRFEHMAQILRDPEHFSSRELTIPKSNSDNVMLPLNLDPPEHTPYRAVLMRHFDRKVIAGMEPRLREWAMRLIERVAPDGRCDFTETLGAAFPVSIFMELLGVPLERFEELRGIVKEYFSRTSNARYIELQNTMISIFTELVEDRKRSPKADLISKLVGETVNGRPLTMAELQSFGFLLFLGGLDTVANALTFTYHNLAQRPDLQQRLTTEPEKIPDFVEESLRCFGIVHQTRIVKKNVEIAGAHFHEGDMVSCALPLAGLDDRRNPDPDKFDIDRKGREHIVFSTGAHLCIGAALARAEMRVFTEEWVKRIPSFRLQQGAKLDWRAGQVMALMNLPLEWPA